MAGDFHELTETGRAGRLREIARLALEDYDLEVTRLRLVSNSWNCVFRVDSTSGSYALRVTMPRSGEEVSIAAETAFMDALEKNTDISLPSLLRTRDGRMFTEAAAPGVPESRSCVVFRWLGGRDLAEARTAENWRRLGDLMARMHDFASEWSVPSHLTLTKYDASIHYGEEAVVFDPGRFELFGLRELLLEAWVVTDQRINELNRCVAPIVVHGDLHQWNVKVKRGVLSPFDFEEVLYAAPILDAATSLFYVRDDTDFPVLARAFRSGYEQHRPWVETEPGELDRLMMARSLELLNVVALEPEVEVDNWEAFVKRRERVARVALGQFDPVEIV